MTSLSIMTSALQNWRKKKMNINWKIRLKSLPFWAGMLSALVVFGQSIVPLFGLTIDFGPIQDAVNA
ncbi:phage holin, partial [Eubacterium callanderi]|uniref:phage holin n=1 Tax=Eubacterium callanderi TaxID=53442 RepID=UPI003CC81C03